MWTWVVGRGKDGRWVEGVGCGRGVLGVVSRRLCKKAEQLEEAGR
jgi:hypothetical protein